MDQSGNKPFVFVSYSHRDKEKVIPILNRLISDGVELWYDSGIEAGSEWPDYIAQKILDCDRMICFISDGYAGSKNCSRELYFAISRNKPVLSIYLEDKVDMAPGMMMNLESYQSLFYTRFDGKDSFCDALLKESYLDSCKTASDKPVQTEKKVEVKETNTVRTPPTRTKRGSLERSEADYIMKLQRVEEALSKNPDNGELKKKCDKLEKTLHRIDIAKLKRDNASARAKVFKVIGVVMLCMLLLCIPERLVFGFANSLPVTREGFGQAAVTAMVILGIFCLFDLFLYDYYNPVQRFIGTVTYLVTLCGSVVCSLWCCGLLSGWLNVTAIPVLFYLVVILAFVVLNMAMTFIRYMIWAIIEPMLNYA